MAATDQPAPPATRRSQILRAAAELFSTSGARGTSIAAVASRVGITDAGVLYHFKTKEHLLLGVLDEYGREVQTEIQRAGVHGVSLLRMVREWGAGMEERPEISALLIVLTAEHLTVDSSVRQALQARYRKGTERYETAFAQAAAAGDLRPDLDPHHEAAALIAHLDGIRLQWFLTDRSFSMADSVRRYVDDTLTRLAP